MNSHRRSAHSPDPTPSCSQPLHVKRIEKALDLQLYLNQYSYTSKATHDSDLTAEEDSQDTSDDNAVKLDILMNGTPFPLFYLFNIMCYFLMLRCRHAVQ